MVTTPQPKIVVIAFESLSGEKVRDSLKIRRSLEKGQSRECKFIVLRASGANRRPVFVIGPPLGLQKYHHKDLFNLVMQRLGRKAQLYQISGGGSVRFSLESPNKWSAEVGGISEDFGVYDRVVLQHAEWVSRWLKMPVRFGWLDWVYPD